MIGFLKKSIRTRLTITLILVLAAAMSIAAYVSAERTHHSAWTNLVNDGKALGRFMALISPEPILSLDYETLDRYVVEMTSQPDVVYAFLSGPNGNLMAAYAAEPDGRNGQGGRINKLENLSFIKKQPDVFPLMFDIKYENSVIGQLELGLTRKRIDNIAKSSFLNQTFLNLVIIALISLFIYLAFHFTILQPLKTLHQGVKRVSEGDLEHAIQVNTSDELGQLATSFNMMTQALHASIEDKDEALNSLTKVNRKLEDATRAKSVFLANMSHELRTPLNAIIGYSEMMLDDATEQGRSHEVKDLKKIRFAGKHLLSLINGILDLSKIEAGRMDTFIELFAIDKMITSVAEMIEPLVDENDNHLSVEIPDGIGTMHGDLTKVRQSLFNLLSNATKFTKGGEITLAVDKATENDMEYVVFSVRDTGIGIAPDQQERLFQDFSQADDSTTRRFGGTGLGLAITKRFCTMMGGDIRVDSTLGSGTAFTIRLPVDGRQTVTQPPQKVRALGDRRGQIGTILVVDDDPDILEHLCVSLGREGFFVDTALNAEEGLKKARQLKPDVITLDVLMPGMNGWSMLNILKSDQELREIPVVILSVTDDIQKGLSLGATEILPKPVDRRQLISSIKRVMRGSEGSHILLVEDDLMTRGMLKEFLEREGWLVKTAENGRIAMQYIEQEQPALVLLDLMMPEMDGFEVVSRLRCDPQKESIPVVVLTAMDLDERDQMQLDGKVEKVLMKAAYDRNALLNEIRKSMSRRTQADDADPISRVS